MGRRSSSVPGRGLFLVLLAAILLWVVYDLASPGSLLRSGWHSLVPGSAPVEGVRDDMVDRLGIPR